MRLLLTGDSIIARNEGKEEPHINWNLKKMLPDVEIENTAVSGSNSGAFFARLNELVLSVKKCDNLVILLGTNDLATHKQVPLTQFKQNMKLICSAIICAYYPPHVLLVSPPAVDEEKQLVRIMLGGKYAEAVEEVAKNIILDMRFVPSDVGCRGYQEDAQGMKMMACTLGMQAMKY